MRSARRLIGRRRAVGASGRLGTGAVLELVDACRSAESQQHPRHRPPLTRDLGPLDARINVVGEAKDGYDAVDLARLRAPDVVLMDIQMPGLDGLEAARRILGTASESPIAVLMLTTFDLNEYVYDALRAGASGFLLKDVSSERSSPPSGSSPPATR